LNFEGAWSETFAEAVVARCPDETRALEDRGAHDALRNLVVEPYLIEVREAVGALSPVRYRERVRVAGPSMLADVPGYAPERLWVEKEGGPISGPVGSFSQGQRTGREAA